MIKFFRLKRIGITPICMSEFKDDNALEKERVETSNSIKSAKERIKYLESQISKMEEEFGKITEDDQKQISQYSELKLSIKKIRTNANKVMPTNSKVDKRLLYYSENLEPFGTLPGIYLMLDLDEKTKKDYYAKLKEFSKFPKEIVEAVSLKKKLSECEKDLAYKKRELMEKEIYYYSIASLLNNSRINEKEEERLNNFIESFIIDGWVLKSITPIVSGAFDIHYGGGTLTEFGGKVSTGGGYGYSYTDGVLLHFEK